jgi:hypothetical protein
VFAKVVDEVARGEHVDGAQVLPARGVVVVACETPERASSSGSGGPGVQTIKLHKNVGGRLGTPIAGSKRREGLEKRGPSRRAATRFAGRGAHRGS